MTAMREVQLRTGKDAPVAAVTALWLRLRRIMATPDEAETDASDTRTPAEHLQDALMIYELAKAARDRTHVMFGNLGQRAVDAGLAEDVNEDGTVRMHEIIRDIIEAATELTDADVSLRNPLPQREDTP